MLSQSQLEKIVKLALQDNDPQTYKQLQESGELDQWAKLRAEAALKVRDDLRARAVDEAATSNLEPMERIRNHYMKNREADEIAISQATEFTPAIENDGPET